MPPKKPGKPDKPDDPKTKKPEEKKEEGKKDPEKVKPPTGNKSSLASLPVQLAALLLPLALFLIALLFLYLYKADEKEVADMLSSMTRIHQFMVKYNDSYKDSNESDAMIGVDALLYRLVAQRAENEDVKKSIDDVIQKLKDGWIIHNTHLYLFSTRAANFTDAVKECANRNTSLIAINSREEQTFLVNHVYRLNRPTEHHYWIGAIRGSDNEWTWVNNDTWNPDFKFWKERPRQSSPCAFVTTCYNPPHCWEESRCGVAKRIICEMKPDARWM